MADDMSPAGDPESAKVIALVSSIPLAVDLARYDLAESAFAPEVKSDVSEDAAARLRGGRRDRSQRLPIGLYSRCLAPV